MTDTPVAPVRKPNRTVFDTQGNAYELTGKLGEGGQGMVFSTDQPRILVKLVRDTSPDKQREWLSHIQWIRRQGLANLKLLLPMGFIAKPRYGYLLELLDDLEPLTSVVERCHRAVLEDRSCEEYAVSGGLKRRYRLLAQLSRTLSELHGRGLVFGDLAPDNVYVSRSVDHAEAWLIDCDNLSPLSRNSKQHTFTPGFGAPEVVRGESGTNSLTDSWSFAVVAFELLAMAHPLRGDAVNSSGPESEEEAYRGEWPWVDHPTDTRNSLSTGLPRSIVQTQRLAELFSRCFGEGIADPGARPGLAAWAEAFESAEANTVNCTSSDCGQSFLLSSLGQCPFCDAAQTSTQTLLLRHSLFVPSLDREIADMTGEEVGGFTASDEVPTESTIALELGQTFILRKAPIGSTDYARSPERCSLTLTDDGLVLKPAGNGRVSIERARQSKTIELSKESKLHNRQRSQATLILRLGETDAPHDGWLFSW